MKKLVCVIVALVLFSCLFDVAFADNGASEYNWNDVGSVVLSQFNGNGNFGLIEEVDATIWVPGYYLLANLTEEEKADNCIGYLLTEDGSSFILLYYLDMPVASLDALFSFYRGNGYNARMVTVNGIPAVLYQDMESDSLALSYQTVENKLFQVFFYPASDENFAVLYDLIIASIMPNETPAGTETELVVSDNPVSGLISK